MPSSDHIGTQNILDNSLVSIIYTQTLSSVDIREHTVAELCQAHVDKVYGLYSGTGQMVFNVALYVYEVARQHKTRREINNSKKRYARKEIRGICKRNKSQ